MKGDKKWGCIVVLIVLIIGWIVIDIATAVRPEWPAPREGDPVPRRPDPDDPPFHRTPLAPTYEERRALFLEWVATHETSERRGGIWTDIAKLEYGQTAVSDAALRDALDFVNAREDTADFVIAGLMRLYYKHADTGHLSARQVADIEQAFLNFKYWLDEPNPTEMELWTENHQILAHSAEYLAGQLFPDQVFSNNGQTGRWHAEQARHRILRWIDWHARTGFAEWDSIPYLTKDMAALLNLVDFAEDEEVARRAAMMYAFTHAYFPRWAFDRVVEAPVAGGGGWIFGQKGNGYVALYSHQPYRWQEDGPDAGQELIALGQRNVWICQLGRQAVDGSFDDFVAAITAAPLEVRGLRVSYQAPGIGAVTFDWDGPLRVDGQEIPLRDHDRWSNPYTRAEFGTGQYAIEFAGKRLVLDFERGVRTEQRAQPESLPARLAGRGAPDPAFRDARGKDGDVRVRLQRRALPGTGRAGDL